MSVMEILAWSFLGFGVVSFVIVLTDICMGRYQYTPIMNLAWPLTVLYSGPIGLFLYYKFGRVNQVTIKGVRKPKKEKKRPEWFEAMASAAHSGSGCALAVIISEIVIYWVGIYIFGHMLWSSFLIDFGAALVLGSIFQYYVIRPMKPRLSASAAFGQAIKADFLSIFAFLLGLFGWLLSVHFIYDGQLGAGEPLYWFMLQIGLTIGLLIAYPINVWLIDAGIKKPCI